MLDLNADLGESEISWNSGRDKELLQYLSSVNISCGFHAGTDKLILETILESQKHGLRIGAHPGYHDKKNFGRVNQPLTPELASDIIEIQLHSFLAKTNELGIEVSHVKPHGAFYNQLASDKASALACCEKIKHINPGLILFGLPGSELEFAAYEVGLAFMREGFADRRYDDQGRLVPRSASNALIESLEMALEQVEKFQKGYVTTASGKDISLQIDTICIHGDSPNALEFAREISIMLGKN